MSEFHNKMNQVVQSFVGQITELARRAAIGTLASAFGGRGGRAQVLPPARNDVPGRRRGARGAKRTAADLDSMSSNVVALVKAKPGLRMEEINKELGTTTKDLRLPIRKLIADSVLTSKGQKRSTKYFPGRKAS